MKTGDIIKARVETVTNYGVHFRHGNDRILVLVTELYPLSSDKTFREGDVAEVMIKRELGACRYGGSLTEKSMDKPLALSAVIFTNSKPNSRLLLSVGQASVFAEIAATPERTSKGLSGRTQLESDRGMLFVMPTVDRHSFWMRDTYVPLSIAFLAEDGTIQEIRDMTPLSEARVTPGQPSRLMLEVQRGFFERHGVGVGDRVRIGAASR